MGRKKKIKPVKKSVKWVKKHKILVISLAVVLIIIFALSGTKLWLYLKVLLGNDTIVKLEVDKNNLYIKHGEEETVEFETTVTTNPFCTALCTYNFLDISKGTIIKQDNFTIRPSTPLKKEYLISPPKLGTGLYLYRFDLECHSIRTVLCHTKEEPSTRSILITVNYDLDEEEKGLKENLKGQIENLTKKFSYLQGQHNAIKNISDNLNEILVLEDRTDKTKEILNLILNEIYSLKGIWGKEDYKLLYKNVITVKDDLQKAEKLMAETNNSLFLTTNSYNQIIDDIALGKDGLEELKQLTIINNTIILEINKLIDEFNIMLETFNKKSTLPDKKELQESINKKIVSLKNSTEKHIRKEALRKELEINVNYDLLCEINSQCISHSSIVELANKTDFDLNITCSKIDEQKKLFEQTNESIKDEFAAQNYPATDEFWENIKSTLHNKKQKIIENYLEQLPENTNNREIIKEILISQQEKETTEYEEYNLTFAFISELTNQPGNCIIPNISLNGINDINLFKIEVKEVNPVLLNIVFEEQPLKCCVFGKCEDCCLTQECKEDPSTFPVVFLHGHAIDKKTSAEYSLEGFNEIQKRLEEDNYLNAGTVTLYTLKDTPPGIWGMPKVPLTIRTSYYFDVFEEPENYVVIQAKSENIDTYAVRLKELIDVIEYKTGKPKVNIIAFSMGGLVTRRYIQIFGTDSVNKVILIGTPNKGIAGKIADYCPITGENLECRDMNSNSLFINKLNREPLPNIPIYNIVGTGCSMDGNIGDGVVLEEKALLEGAKNYIIEGKCPSVTEPLHLNLRNIDLYPRVYEIIKEALEEK